MANVNAIRIRPRRDKVPSAANLAHNSALTKAKYWLDDGSNIVQSHSYNNHKLLNEDWNQWITEANERYLQNPNTKTKLRKQAVRIEEGLIIIGSDVEANQEQIKSITQDFIKKFEEENNTKVKHWAIHDHEGHIDDDNQNQIINRHVHFLFDNVNKDGEIIRSKWKKDYLSKLQTNIFDISEKYIDIERARNTVGMGIRGEHHRNFRRKKEIESKEQKEDKKDKEYKQEKAKVKDLQKEIKKLRELLKESGAKRPDYAKLEELNRNMKQKIKEKDLSIERMMEKIKELENKLITKDEDIEKLQQQINLLQARNNANLGLNQKLKKDKKMLEKKLEKLMEKMEKNEEISDKELKEIPLDYLFEKTDKIMNELKEEEEDKEPDGKDPQPNNMSGLMNQIKNEIIEIPVKKFNFQIEDKMGEVVKKLSDFIKPDIKEDDDENQNKINKQ